MYMMVTFMTIVKFLTLRNYRNNTTIKSRYKEIIICADMCLAKQFELIIISFNNHVFPIVYFISTNCLMMHI
jgi:predicted CDP-diglyceride synthetase/phosphatidate cytidylyltransferase